MIIIPGGAVFPVGIGYAVVDFCRSLDPVYCGRTGAEPELV